MHLNNILLPLLFLNSQSWNTSSLFSLVVSYVSVCGQTDACKPFPFFFSSNVAKHGEYLSPFAFGCESCGCVWTDRCMQTISFGLCFLLLEQKVAKQREGLPPFSFGCDPCVRVWTFRCI